MKFHAIEGNRFALDGGSLFGHVPKTLWKNWVEVDSENRISLASRGLLVECNDGRKVLFETGIGNFFSPKLKERYQVAEEEHVLLKSLSSHGLSHEDIDAVVLSHLHFDHCGGLFIEGTLGFPNAEIFVGKRHWEYAKQPHKRERGSFIPDHLALIEGAGRLQLIDEKSHPKLDFVRFYESNGHTVGMLLAEIEGLLFASDLVPGRAWLKPIITMGFDRYAEKMVEEKEHIVSKFQRLFFMHDLEKTFYDV